MKSLALLLFALLAGTFSVTGQVHILLNPDSVTNCRMLSAGSFQHMETCDRATAGYSIAFSDSLVTERTNGGKTVVRSVINRITPCGYILTVRESNDPAYSGMIGKRIESEILQTSTREGLVLIQSRIQNAGAEWQSLVLQKISD